MHTKTIIGKGLLSDSENRGPPILLLGNMIMIAEVVEFSLMALSLYY